ncbi:AIPR family protein [uncultured Fibrobacter sp.]|uniref:AIPR family protein n=1 Tax=uncultured Fibrobacter sp. TaxID=261512 RepID=UPI0025E8DE08|nr:AIPR family protein [uncultured Fibrobacter sp.]
MSSNDLILVDGIVEKRISDKGLDIHDAKVIGREFEMFAVEQILKKYALTDDDFEYACVDGRGDSGIDFAFLLINGLLLKSLSSFPFPKSDATMEIIFVTSKHEESFILHPLESISSSSEELFNFKKKSSEIDSNLINEKILKFRENVIDAYKKLAYLGCSPKVKYFYVSRGDSSLVSAELKSTSRLIQSKVSEKLSESNVSFDFIGCSELINMYRDHSLEKKDLRFENSITCNGNYIVISKIQDYYAFIKQDDGNINRRMFDANVRDYMGLNRVNEDILKSLKDNQNVDFWCMNNGITVIADSLNIVANNMYLNNPQIVNGLQTSESICSYFKTNMTKDDLRHVLIRIVICPDSETQKKIVRATNNQTPVEFASLYATEKYQQSLEEYLKRFDLYYDRKKNFYKNCGIPSNKIVNLIYLASGYMSIVIKKPHVAARIKQKNVNNVYTDIFNEKNSLTVWPNVVKISQKVENYLCKLNPQKGISKFSRTWRAVFSYLSAAVVFENFAYSSKDVESCDVDALFNDTLLDTIKNCFLTKYGRNVFKSKWSNQYQIFNICIELEKLYGIKNIGFVQPSSKVFKEVFGLEYGNMNEDFVEQVYENLPKQPWPKRTSIDLCQKMKVPMQYIQGAIELLVERGRVYKQKDGVLYDLNGNVVSV